MISDPEVVIRKLAAAFQDLNIPYFIGGSVASSTWGEQRLTSDVDFVADLHPETVPLLVAALEAEFYIDAQMILDALDHQSSFNVIELASMTKADVFICKNTPRGRAEMARRRRLPFTDTDLKATAYYASAEDTILHKLDWYRQGGGVSDRQWRDIVGVFKTRGKELDFEYLRRWAADLDLTDLLDRAMGEAGQLPK